MLRSALTVLCVVFLANYFGWSIVGQTIEPRAWTMPISGVSFSPFRADQDPRAGHMPSAEEIDADLALLAGPVAGVRTYGSTNGLDQIAKLASGHGLTVTAGAHIDSRRENNAAEIDSLVTIAKQNRNVTRLLVGNEVLLRNDISADELIAYIREVRSRTNKPVSAAEPWHIWLANPALGREVDFIAIHILPYWEGLPVEAAVEYVFRRYQEIKDAYPTKPVVITEVGWPSQGRMRQGAEPTPTAQAYFVREFLNEANRRGLDYYVMEAFDQPWKHGIEGSVGAYWGLFDADRESKFPLRGPVSSSPDWQLLALAAALLSIVPILLFLARWPAMRPGGKLFFAGMIQTGAAVVVFVAHSGLSRYLDASGIVMWSTLVPLLVLLLLMVLSEGLEFSEVVFGQDHTRKFLPFVPANDRAWPKVSIHLPIHNEPPEMVKKTLEALARLNYPNFEVLVIDNNTRDEAVWRPVESRCAALGERFRFFHVENLAGFKAGALNFALARTAPDAEIVGVIDSDYLVEPDWLMSLTPYFDRPKVGFVQAPQDHYDWRTDRFKEMINFEYAGFFHIGMVQRNEADAIIQHGTMTLMRRQALEAVGGWAEWCICEDAEMGMKLLASGWQSVYVNHRFGYGVTPDTFSGYKSQRFRWAYGAVQILKARWRDLVFKDSKLTPLQRYHFIAGWMPWFADALGVVFAVAGLAWTIGVFAFPKHFEFPLTLFILPALIVFGAKIVQFLLLYKLRVESSFRQRLGAGLAGLALTYTVAKATLYGLFTSKLPFIRTPKRENEPALIQALAMAQEEAVLFVLLWAAGISVGLVYGGDDPEAALWALLMMVQSLPYGAAVALSCVNALPQFKRRPAVLATHAALTPALKAEAETTTVS